MFTAFSLLVVALASALLGKRYGAAAERKVIARTIALGTELKKEESSILSDVKVRVNVSCLDRFANLLI